MSVSRNCPRCGRPGSVFINHDNYMAVECIYCRLGWKVYDDGSWELIVGQDKKTLEVKTSSALVVWDEWRQ